MEEGYGAVSSRSVAARVGMHASNVHYYFPTLDELFMAILERGAGRAQERLAAALASPRPLMALWRISADRRSVALLNELMSAANHRKVLRARVAELAGVATRGQVEAFRTLVHEYELPEATFPPELLAAVVQGTGLLVARQGELGLATEHAAVCKAVEALIEALESLRERGRTSA